VSPRRYDVDQARGTLEVDWPLFGELSRALALKVARAYDPELVIGIATAGVIPGATIAAILDREFHSLVVSRRYRAESPREAPELFSALPDVRGRRVLIVDETCDTGATLRLATAALRDAGAGEVRTAASFQTGEWAPDFHALATGSTIILPWDRELLVDGALVTNPLYREALDDGSGAYRDA